MLYARDVYVIIILRAYAQTSDLFPVSLTYRPAGGAQHECAAK